MLRLIFLSFPEGRGLWRPIKKPSPFISPSGHGRWSSLLLMLNVTKENVRNQWFFSILKMLWTWSKGWWGRSNNRFVDVDASKITENGIKDAGWCLLFIKLRENGKGQGKAIEFWTVNFVSLENCRKGSGGGKWGRWGSYVRTKAVHHSWVNPGQMRLPMIISLAKCWREVVVSLIGSDGN